MAIKKKVTFTKLFNSKVNVDKAISMINDGYSNYRIAKYFNCDKSSIIAFRRRKEKEGIKFKKKRVFTLTIDLSARPIFYPPRDEIINEGKSYAEYLSSYIKKRDKLHAKLMKKAKVTIDQVRKKRIKDGTDDDDIWNF
jgi:hypothetical protein